MNKAYCKLVPVIALALTACAGSATPAPIPTVILDVVPQTSSVSGGVSASAVIVPVKKVELGFPTGGVVKTVEVVAGDLVSVNQPLVTLDTAILEARVAEAEANVVTQSTTLKYLQRTIDVGASQERLDAAQANIDGAVAAVDIAPAEFANPGQIVVTMGDLAHFQVETTDLSEKDVPSVKIGQSASIAIEALNQEVRGTVTDIARVSTTVGGDVVYKVTIAFDEQPGDLRWGMSADVKIDTR